jgi:hypothetical protein
MCPAGSSIRHRSAASPASFTIPRSPIVALLQEFLQAPRVRGGGRFGAESLERCLRGTLLDQARLAVADAEMCFREERSGLCPFVGCVGLLPELLRCDEVRYGLFSCPGRAVASFKSRPVSPG